ncbi:unnamed protein product [Pleuronectes platessa]|uniref:Uncharacterized protein n=1 Tax=Pleuronectes platessa TaxID=8262 RepID=A0A9N7YCD8_PLEPL|nr:unnamed protein product [Pleuronectes platessa]
MCAPGVSVTYSSVSSTNHRRARCHPLTTGPGAARGSIHVLETQNNVGRPQGAERHRSTEEEAAAQLAHLIFSCSKWQPMVPPSCSNVPVLKQKQIHKELTRPRLLIKTTVSSTRRGTIRASEVEWPTRSQSSFTRLCPPTKCCRWRKSPSRNKEGVKEKREGREGEVAGTFSRVGVHGGADHLKLTASSSSPAPAPKPPLNTPLRLHRVVRSGPERSSVNQNRTGGARSRAVLLSARRDPGRVSLAKVAAAC